MWKVTTTKHLNKSVIGFSCAICTTSKGSEHCPSRFDFPTLAHSVIFGYGIIHLYGVDHAVFGRLNFLAKTNTDTHAKHYGNKLHRYTMVVYATYALNKRTS